MDTEFENHCAEIEKLTAENVRLKAENEIIKKFQLILFEFFGLEDFEKPKEYADRAKKAYLEIQILQEPSDSGVKALVADLKKYLEHTKSQWDK